MRGAYASIGVAVWNIPARFKCSTVNMHVSMAVSSVVTAAEDGKGKVHPRTGHEGPEGE